MNASIPSHAHLLHATIARYQCQFGERPPRMRASVGFNIALLGEQLLVGKGNGMAWGGQHLAANEFEFAGVIVACDLPTDVPTVLAQWEPW